MKKLTGTALAIGMLLSAGQAFASENDSQVVRVDPFKVVEESGDFSVMSTAFNYEARFSHLIYSSGALSVSSGNVIVLNGYQEATNSNYPTTRVNYRFTKSDGNTNPDDDVVLTEGVTYSGVGYINNREFKVTTGGNAKLRLWNYENYSGSNKNYTIYADGNVKKK